MRICLFFLLTFLAPGAARSQSDIPSNSFEEVYRKTNPAINYRYDSLRQTHDYSGNWDFDQDGTPDQLFFVGTGGAHLYYFLRVVLSADSMLRNFSFLQSDFLVLPSYDEWSKARFNPDNGQTQFAVLDNGKEIFIKLDAPTFDVGKKALTKKGIKTNLVTITFKNGTAIFKDLANRTP